MLVEGLTFLRERFKQRLSSDPKETKALERDTTLLTGAMGFLGAFLLRALARALRLPVDSGRVKASHRIICLVRAKSDRDALVRVQKALKYYRIILPENAPIILGIAGDLEKPPLGFSEEKYVELGIRLCGIFHCGAHVTSAFPYATLKESNVGGTRRIIELALLAPELIFERIKHPKDVVSKCKISAKVNFISTMGFLSQGHSEFLDVSDTHPVRRSRYAHSKNAADQIVRRSGCEATVFRPGVISGDSVSG